MRLYVNFSSFAQDTALFSMQDASSVSQCQLWFDQSTDQLIYSTDNGVTSAVIGSFAATYSIDTWYQCVITHDQAVEDKLYFSAASNAAAIAHSFSQAGHFRRIGRSAGIYSYCRFDEIAFWTGRVLTPTNVSGLAGVYYSTFA